MPDYNVAAMNGLGFMPYNNYYNNQVALSGLYDDYSPMGFNNGLIGFNPSFSGMNYDQYFNQMMDYQNFTSRYQLQTIQNQRNNEVAINAPMESIQGTANVLNEKIVANEQEQIMGAWESYVNAVRNAYPEADEATIIARAKSHYQQIYGTSLNDDVRKYGKSSFAHGFMKTITLGMYHGKSAEDNIAELTGQPVGKMEGYKKIAGGLAGGATLAGAAIVAPKVVKGLWKVGGWKGFLIGGVLAAGAAIGGLFTSKN